MDEASRTNDHEQEDDPFERKLDREAAMRHMDKTIAHWMVWKYGIAYGKDAALRLLAEIERDTDYELALEARKPQE